MKSTYFHLGITAALLIVVLIVYGVWYHALGSLRAHVAALSAEVAMKNQSGALAIVAEKELERRAAHEKAIQAYFVSPEDIVSFLESLQSIGASLGAKVNVLSVSSHTVPRQHLVLSVRVSGSFDAVMRTVGAIEYSAHDIMINGLSLDTSPATEKTAAGWVAALTLYVGTASSTASAPVPATTP